ncbi:hypothetical protein Hanom_Chr15g01345441 [Helianthus anomalus]
MVKLEKQRKLKRPLITCVRPVGSSHIFFVVSRRWQIFTPGILDPICLAMNGHSNMFTSSDHRVDQV